MNTIAIQLIIKIEVRGYFWRVSQQFTQNNPFKAFLKRGAGVLPDHSPFLQCNVPPAFGFVYLRRRTLPDTSCQFANSNTVAVLRWHRQIPGMMALVCSSSLANVIRNHLVFYVSHGSLCWRRVWNWLYACYVHYWFLEPMNGQLFARSDEEKQPPCINNPHAAEYPKGLSAGVGFHTNSSPQICPLGIQEKDLRRVFERLDGDGDGMVSGDDIQRLLQNLGLHCDKNIILHDDDEEQYFVNFDDFCNLCLSLFAYDEDQPEEGLMMEAFGVFDENGDGFINHRDLQRLLLSLGFNEAQDLEFCKKMIKRFDINCDGRIDFVEFENMMMNTAS